MSGRGERLELTWVGKRQRPRAEPRVLIEDNLRSYHASRRMNAADEFENVLVHGDNLLALKALESSHSGLVRCVYIDPPYNTGTAFEHYDDGVEHSRWLSLMRDRLELLHSLLSQDGVLFCSIDDSEMPYLTVLCDEIFGRSNSCGMFVWEKKKKPSFLNASMGVVTEYILAYARNRRLAPSFVGGTTTPGKKYPLNNAGNGIRVLAFPPGAVEFNMVDQVVTAQDMSDGNIVTRLLDRVTIRSGRNVDAFRLEGEWRYSQSRLDELLASDERIVISKAPFRPNHVKEGGEPKKLKNLLTVAHYGMATYEDATHESVALFGTGSMFDYPKPERLLHTLIGAVTNPGDLVLDSFAGSGTTGAVAHKMGRRWIMIEQGEHCHTHIIPRLRKVIDGEDPGGVTEATGWKGGGGFRYFRVAPSLMEQDRFGNWVLSGKFEPAMLAEAVCKLEGFRYEPSDSVYWMHGRSTESDFLYVTRQTLAPEDLARLSEEVGEQRTLLVMCGAWRCRDLSRFPNLTVRKIPQAVLNRCEWGKDDYSLAIAALPPLEPAAETEGGDSAAPAAGAASSPAPATGTGKGKRIKKDKGAGTAPLFRPKAET